MLIFGSGFTYTLFDFAKYGAAGVGHDCIDAMVILMALKNPYIGIAIIAAVFGLLCWKEVKYKKGESKALNGKASING